MHRIGCIGLFETMSMDFADFADFAKHRRCLPYVDRLSGNVQEQNLFRHREILVSELECVLN